MLSVNGKTSLFNRPHPSHVAADQRAYLSQVDVNGVLQELRGLPGSLLYGEDPDCFHAGLQLDHACVLILWEMTGGGGGGEGW